MSYYHNHEWATETLESARNKSAGKPVQNNTRLFEREDGAIGVKFHAVDVVTINADGTYTLRNGGWNTVTTIERIRGYSPAKIGSDRGEWFITIEPSDDDPKPDYVSRTVPKPYTPTWTPTPEPVKNDNGCQAGTMLGTDHIDEIVEVWRKDVLDNDEIVEDTYYGEQGNYDRIKVKRTWTSWVFYGEDAHDWYNAEWKAVKTDHANVTYEQCPHCKAFDTEHERWRYGMHGDRWGTRFDQQTGYATYEQMMNRYHNDKELWQQAYIEDFRARRAYLKAEREWTERNRVPFYDGITVNSEGYAPRVRKDGPSPAKLRRHKKEVKRVKTAIDKYVDGFIAALTEGMPMPGAGDCFYCAMRTDTGQTLGDAVDTLHADGSLTQEVNTDHLWSHFEEKYYVPSLITNAMIEHGYKPVGVYMMLDMNQDTQMMGGGRTPYDGAKRDLKKYLQKRLIPQAPTG